MTGDRAKLNLYEGVVSSGLSYAEIWEQQAIFGGTAGVLEVEAYILGLLHADDHQHDLIAQAINEHFIDEGGDHPVAYSDRIPG